MYINYLSVKGLYPPLANGGLWRTWCLLLFSGIRHYPPKPCGGANHKTSKGLTNIRHLTAKRESGIILYGGLQKKISEKTKNRLTIYTIYRIFQFMTMIRKAIIKRMNELNLNPNRLSVMLKDEIPRQTIYDFLSGKTDARTEVVSALMKALDLEIKPTKKKKAR
jgi:hypothetical protein